MQGGLTLGRQNEKAGLIKYTPKPGFPEIFIARLEYDVQSRFQRQPRCAVELPTSVRSPDCFCSSPPSFCSGVPPRAPSSPAKARSRESSPTPPAPSFQTLRSPRPRPHRAPSSPARTSSSGDFDLSPLNPDIYRVTVTAKGFQTLTQENVHVNALEVSDLKLALTVGSESQSIDVSAAPPQLETSNATLGATMEKEMYSALPIEMGAYGQPDQRRATDFAFLMPGVQGNNTNGNATTNTGIVNGSGSRGAASAVYIDGIPFVRAGGNGDPRFVWTAISVDAVDQFQVQTTGYSAIYEGQGIQNYTIKQGGNKYHGAVYEFFRNTALDTWGFFGPANINPVTGKPSPSPSSTATSTASTSAARSFPSAPGERSSSSSATTTASATPARPRPR